MQLCEGNSLGFITHALLKSSPPFGTIMGQLSLLRGIMVHMFHFVDLLGKQKTGHFLPEGEREGQTLSRSSSLMCVWL